jgi:biopolymer transport protein ExbD
MALRRPHPRRTREPAIPLINVVLLMLIFFLIAGAVAPPLDSRVRLVDTAGLEGRAPPDAAVILSDGTMVKGGTPISPEDLVEADRMPRLVPDRSLPAADLVAVTRQLRELGAEEVWLVTERRLE